MLTTRALEEDQEDLDTKIESERKKSKPQASYNSEFWSRAAIVAGLEKDRVSISRQISIRDFAGDRDTFESTETAKELILKMKAMETSQKLYLEQAKCLNTEGDAEKVTRRSFIAMFTTSTLGLKILNTGMGPRKP